VRRWIGRVALIVGLAGATGCVVVPQTRRGHLADPMMDVGGDRAEDRQHRRIYGAREGAAGGDGAPAGGGCGCQ